MRDMNIREIEDDAFFRQVRDRNLDGFDFDRSCTPYRKPGSPNQCNNEQTSSYNASHIGMKNRFTHKI